MSIFQIALVAWFSYGAALTVALIGRERKPITPGVAVGALIISAAWIMSVVIWG